MFMSGSVLTVIPARFTNEEAFGINSVGEQTDHETKRNGSNRVKYIVSIFGIDEFGLNSCRWL